MFSHFSPHTRKLPSSIRRLLSRPSSAADPSHAIIIGNSLPRAPPSLLAGAPSPSSSPAAAGTIWIHRFSHSPVSLVRMFSSLDRRIDEMDDAALEEEAEKKAGWLLKAVFVVTAGVVAWQFFPYMGDNLLLQSISLLRVKDPLFKRMGASRLSRFAIDDERRMKVVEMGGAQELINMLETAKDDKTRKFTLKTLVALSHSDAAADALNQLGAAAIVSSVLECSDFPEIKMYKSDLLKKFQELKRDSAGP